MSQYVVTRSHPQTYLDSGNNVIQGFRVYYTNLEFNEADFVDVPSRNADIVGSAIEAEMADRRELSKLGK